MRRWRHVTTSILEERIHFCRTSPGCHYAAADGRCCGAYYWAEVSREDDEAIEPESDED